MPSYKWCINWFGWGHYLKAKVYTISGHQKGAAPSYIGIDLPDTRDGFSFFHNSFVHLHIYINFKKEKESNGLMYSLFFVHLLLVLGVVVGRLTNGAWSYEYLIVSPLITIIVFLCLFLFFFSCVGEYQCRNHCWICPVGTLMNVAWSYKYLICFCANNDQNGIPSSISNFLPLFGHLFVCNLVAFSFLVFFSLILSAWAWSGCRRF